MRASRRPTFIRLLSALGFAAVLLSCGGSDSTGPGGGNGVTITPNPDTVALGSTITLHAAVTGGSGTPSFFWSSENTSIATVSGTGVVTGVALGSARIAASSGGKSGVATVVVVPPGVASVSVTPSLSTITVRGTVHLQAQPLDASGHALDRAVTWSSDNENVATVDNTGVVTGVSTGTANITATSEGKTGTAGINVGAAVAASITVAPPSVTVTTGQSAQLTATVKDASGNVISGAPVSWTVDNSGVALVSSTGLVAGQSAGTATVTATSGAAHVNVPVTVTLPPANAVVVSPSTVALLITQQQQLTGTVTDAGGHPLSGQTISWQSSNNAVATVSSSGLVTAVLPGSATITGTSGAVSGDAHVTVSLVPVRRVTLTPDALSFTQGDPGTQLAVALLDSIGGTLSGAAHPVTFSSNNTSVASVSSTGFVTPGAVGQAVITVTVTGTGITTTATVTVTQVPVASVTVAPTPDTLVTGRQVQLAATLRDGSGNPLTGRSVTWDGSNDAIAVVTNTGLVTAVSAGTVTITATSEGKTGTATIVVIVPPVNSVSIAPLTRTVVAGATTPAFTATLRDANNNILSGRVVTFASSDPTVATIDATTGVATGVAPGTTSITATSEGKTSSAATLTVTAIPVASVTLSGGAGSVEIGATTPAFTAVTKDGSGNTLTGRTVTFASDNPAVATIDATTGVATGVSAGTANITATSEGKTSTAMTLTVNPAPVGSITISPTNQSVVDGATTPAFTAVTKDAGGHVLTGRTIAWASSNTGVATIAPSGIATGQSPGTTSITASSGGVTSPAATLTVTAVPVATVAISPTSASVVDGATTPAFSAVTKDGSGNTLTGRTVTFASSNPAVATIDPNSGVATGQSPGTTSITASSEGKTSPAATLTVTEIPVNNVVVAPSSASVQVGSTTTFTATPRDAGNNPLSGRSIVYSSSNPAIATINSSTGVATGVAAGTVTIGAISEGKTGTASLTVTEVPVASVGVSPATQTIIDGNSATFTATPMDAGGNALTGRAVTWSSSDITVATVDDAGNATSTGPGTTTITATSEGQSGTATLEVDPVPVSSIVVTPPINFVSVGQEIQLTAEIQEANAPGHGHSVAWTSSDDAIATVDHKGVVTGVSLGAVVITATTQGKSGAAAVTVLP